MRKTKIILNWVDWLVIVLHLTVPDWSIITLVWTIRDWSIHFIWRFLIGSLNSIDAIDPMTRSYFYCRLTCFHVLYVSKWNQYNFDEYQDKAKIKKGRKRRKKKDNKNFQARGSYFQTHKQQKHKVKGRRNITEEEKANNPYKKEHSENRGTRRRSVKRHLVYQQQQQQQAIKGFALVCGWFSVIIR